MGGPTERARHLVLVVLKGDQADPEIVTFACDVALRRGAALRALYAVEVPEPQLLSQWQENTEERGRAVLMAARESARASGCTLQGCMVQTRDAAGAIVEEAVEYGVDIVVMAKPHESARGDASEHVLSTVPCAVLLVRASDTGGA
jgi:nucleotide-binding universal stress UspA family protein